MKSIEIIMLPVADRQQAKEFYLKLGFQVVVEASDAHGQTWLQMGLPGTSTSISLATFQGIICETADIEADINALREQGIDVEPINKTPWGQFAWLKDVDGNRLCLHQQ
ncbi:VOC family protein [Spirosoma endbachense]|uniref:Glyoxalase n=1 Tax=Spirosoma endbachense TaxID=2666025 RepID=A0A6P1W457_9BACT|nr:VOC family protein [Spirosoma endbachense]QHW00242.1 glyoxalase [Spirosoma endbachense]